MATFNRVNSAIENLLEAGNPETDAFRVMLTNTAPVAANAVKADITEISAGNGYAAGGFALTKIASDTLGSTWRLRFADAVPLFTASGGPVGPFRYAVIYNDTPTSPADPLLGWYDYGSAITLAAGEPFNFDVTDANGIVLSIG